MSEDSTQEDHSETAESVATYTDRNYDESTKIQEEWTDTRHDSAIAFEFENG